MAQTVLIVEDDPNSTFLFQTILQRAGYQTASASNGQQAISLLQQITPALVMLDLGLPGDADGIDVLNMIRSTPALRDTRVIVLSAYTDLIKKARDSSADAFITKPVNASGLLQAVRDVLAG